MRVLHLETGRHVYGGARQALDLVQGLQGLGVSNLLICPAGSDVCSAALEMELPVECLPYGGEVDLFAIPRLKRHIQGWQPDVVHLHSRRGADSLGLIAARWAGVPVVLSRRVDHEDAAWLARWRYRNADRIVAISDIIRQVVLSQGAEEGKVALVYSAVDVDQWTAPRDPEGLRAAFSLPRDLPALAMVAQFIPRKGHRDVIAALSDPAVPPVAAVLFGQGALLESTRQAVRDAGLDDRVKLPGFRNDLEQWLPSFDALVHPASAEGLGVAVLQGGASALPVIGGEAGGIPEIIVDGETGILVTPGDVEQLGRAINAVVLDPARARAMGDRGRERVRRHFSVDVMVQGNLDVYRDLLRTS